MSPATVRRIPTDPAMERHDGRPTEVGHARSTPRSEQTETTETTERRVATVGRARPIGLSKGSGVFLAVFVVGAAIARLTGAAAVVLLLIGALVSAGAAAVVGRRAVRRVSVVAVRLPTLIDAGRPVAVEIDTEGFPGRNSALRLRLGGAETRAGWTDDRTSAELTVERVGLVDRCEVAVESPGPAGLVWWRRTHHVPIDLVHVAPAASGPLLELRRDRAASGGEQRTSRHGAPGDLDGLRPWRVGDGEHAVHWPTSLRTGELVGHDRRRIVDDRWEVPRRDAPRFRFTLDEGLRRQVDVIVDGVRVIDSLDAARRAAELAHEERESETDSRIPIWRRTITLSPRLETNSSIGLRDRLLVALCTLVSVLMLQGALGDDLVRHAIAIVGVAATTAWSLWFLRRTPTWWSRAAVTMATLGALARVAADTAGIDGFIQALRGPMPDLLMFLVVLHGAEIADRRTARTHLAITGAVVAYATGLRIDPAVGWWMAAWSIALIVALVAVSGVGTPPRRRPGAVRERVATVAATAAAGVGLAVLVPVPDGPASLGLPAVSQDTGLADQDGALLGPDGSPAASSGEPSTNRGALGQVGGYPGFSETLDTSVRGDLGDEIVMRVRAPEPAFWRGQTFTEFDGRTWRVTPE
ncbi:MAG: transglutaminaseTgpA domain-containing protein [Actinomycetota bacterium]